MITKILWYTGLALFGGGASLFGLGGFMIGVGFVIIVTIVAKDIDLDS